MSFLTSLASAFKGGGAGRVPLARGYISPWATAFGSGPGPRSFHYANAVQEGFIANPIAQRAVRIVSEGVGGAPIAASDPALTQLVGNSCNGQSLMETLAAQLLLHGNAYIQIVKDGAGRPVDLFALRPERLAEDRLDISAIDFAAGEAPSVPLIEVREAA